LYKLIFIFNLSIFTARRLEFFCKLRRVLYNSSNSGTQLRTYLEGIRAFCQNSMFRQSLPNRALSRKLDLTSRMLKNKTDKSCLFDGNLHLTSR